MFPNQCNDRCDSFVVTISHFEEIAGSSYDTLCINYKVRHLFGYGHCDRTLSSFVLRKYPSSINNDRKDINGLIESCETTSGIHCSGSSFCEGKKPGITITPVEEDFNFRLCLRNVFDSDYDFYDRVKFNTRVPPSNSRENYVCTEDHLSALPRLDANKFVSGAYDNSGFNAPGTNYAKTAGDEVAHDTELKTHSSAMDSTIEWSLIGGLSAALMLAMVGIGYCVYRRKKNGAMFERNVMVEELGSSDTVKQKVVVSSHETEMAERKTGANEEDGDLSESEAVHLSTDQV